MPWWLVWRDDLDWWVLDEDIRRHGRLGKRLRKGKKIMSRDVWERVKWFWSRVVYNVSTTAWSLDIDEHPSIRN